MTSEFEEIRVWYERALLLTLILLLVAGCNPADVNAPVVESNASPEVGSQSPDDAATAPKTGTESEPKYTSPAEFESAELKAAMRGIRYESGMAVVDKKVQKEMRGLNAASAQKLFAAGSACLEQNLRIEAIESFTKAVLGNPDDADYYAGLGRALMTEGLVDEAEAAFHSALKRAPDYFYAQFQLAMTKQMQGQQEEANQAWRDTLKIDANDAEAHSRLAIGLYYTGQFAEAWKHVHVAEGLGYNVPPQFRELLAANMVEPAK